MLASMRARIANFFGGRKTRLVDLPVALATLDGLAEVETAWAFWNGWATATCATDGERVVAFFGKGGLHCFTVDGKPLWSKELGVFPGEWGTAASPVIVGDLVIQNCDAAGEGSPREGEAGPCDSAGRTRSWPRGSSEPSLPSPA